MRLFLSITFFIMISAGVAFFSIPTLKEAKRSKMIEVEIESLRLQADKINTENNFLRERIEYIRSDHYKESVAKDRLNLRNVGEKVVVVQPGSEKYSDFKKTLGEETVFDEGETDDKNIPNYMKWWKIISKK